MSAIAWEKSRTTAARYPDTAGARRRLFPAVRSPPTTSSMPSHLARVRMTAITCGCTAESTKNARRLALRAAADHRHRFRRGGRLVEQRRVRHRQAGEVDHHLLEVEQRLEPTLRDLGLVGRVGGVPAGVLEHVALDHRRRVRAVVAHADEVAPQLVAPGVRADLGERLGLGFRLAERERLLEQDVARHHLAHQRVERGRRRAPRASRAARPASGRCGGRRTRPCRAAL